MQEQRRVVALLGAALECSVYVAPTDPGLTRSEFFEVGRRLGLEQGEMNDALPLVPLTHALGLRWLPDGRRIMPWVILSRAVEPEYRNFDAFDYVYTEMKAAVRTHGASAAKLERRMLVERATNAGMRAHDVETAITINVLSGHFVETDGTLRFAPGRETYPSPSEQRRPGPATVGQLDRSEPRAQAYPVVKDIVARRSDGRLLAIEPLDAFAEQLESLGYEPFRLWWQQTVSELRRGDIQSTPVSVTVLAAALVEGALTFVVRHAKAQGLVVFGSTDFDRPPQTWKIDELVKSAARGGDAAILDNPSRLRADSLIHARQRIHAGRMLSKHPGGAPDYRPEEAREAKAVADMVIRRVLDWLSRYPTN